MLFAVRINACPFHHILTALAVYGHSRYLLEPVTEVPAYKYILYLPLRFILNAEHTGRYVRISKSLQILSANFHIFIDYCIQKSKTIGSKIRKYRTARNLSQEQACSHP